MSRALVPEGVRRLADAVLYEGYVLYPYRASAAKNRVRFQWGVLMPPAATALDGSERSAHTVAVLLDGRSESVTLVVRFLQLQRRYVEDAAGRRVERLEAGEATYVPWDEAREQVVTLEVPLGPGGSGPGGSSPALRETVQIDGGQEVEDVAGGRLVRVRAPLALDVEVAVEHPGGPYPVRVLRVRVTNVTEAGPDTASAREEWLRHALVAHHLILVTAEGRFLSLLDPPEWAQGLVEEIAAGQDGLFPVLADAEDRVLLCSPIILYDHASVAAESETGFFDSLEIDELLSLRTLTLTDEERREVRGTDPRAAALLGEVDAMPDELWKRLHGTVRYLESMTGEPEAASNDVPWWDPGAEGEVDPEQATVRVGDRDVGRGSRVLLRPGARRADAHDLFLAGRIATVAAVLEDVDGGRHLAVTVDDDPGSDLKSAHGRYLYFAPDEVEVLEVDSLGSEAPR